MLHIAIIFAGGVGSRMGKDTPKQFLMWNGKTIIVQTLEAFEYHESIDEIIIACKEEWIEHLQKLIEDAELKKVKSVVSGGDSALESQYNALIEARRLHPNEDAVVLVHDGVRPLVDYDTIQKNIDCTLEKGNAITSTRAIETVITIDDDGEVKDILDRNCCRMAKAPQSFKLSDILSVHEHAIADGCHNFIDSASMMMHYGHTMHVVEGKPENIKITTPSDYYMYLGITQEGENRKA